MTAKKNIFRKKKQKIAPVWVAYLCLALALFVTNEIMVTHIHCDVDNTFGLHLYRLADALLLALPVLLLPCRWFSLPWVVVVNVYYLANLWYYRNYFSFIPIRQLLDFSSVGTLGPSIRASMEWRDLWIPLPSILWAIGRCMVQVRQRWVSTGIAAGVALACSVVSSLCCFSGHEAGDREHPRMLYKNAFNRAYKHYGLTNYWVAQLQGLRRCTPEELAEVEAWLAEPRDIPAMAATAEGKNLIVIVVESLSSWEIGLSVEGTPVTPRLNALIADSTACYMPNCLTQIANGRSSDGHLMYETGLLPLLGDPASLACERNTYYSLAKALKTKGYTSAAYVCDDKEGTWHQEVNYAAYGFDTLEDRLGEAHGLYPWNWDSCDQFLFSSALLSIQQLPEPFYAKLVTLSMHDSKPMPQHVTPLNDCTQYEDWLRLHLVRTHYTDSLIGLFVDSLRTCGLYERSLIVVLSDHYRVAYDNFDGPRQRRLSDTFIPFLLLNAPARPDDPQRVFAQQDVYPTLLDLMGLGHYPWRGLGTSLFSPSHPGCATHYSGDTVGPAASHREAQLRLYRLSDILLRSDYFRKHPLE